MLLRALFFSLCVSARIIVLSPPELVKEMAYNELQPGEFHASLANFGNPPYGSSLIGKVFYLPTSSSACVPFPPLDFSADPEARNSAILLVDRGQCLFVVKVRNAQDAGAQAVIVVDNVKGEDVDALIMTDNGSGGNLNIPSFIVSRADGDRIKMYLNQTESRDHVVLQLLFDLKKSPSSVEMALWMSSSDTKVLGFLKDFNRFADKLTKKELIFTPHYSSFKCWHCNDGDIVSGANEDCLASGKYCALDPDGAGPLTGRHVLLENLRQICIFKQTVGKDTYSLWFDYMSEFNATCSTDFSEPCSQKIMKDVGIPSDQVDLCVKQSVKGADINVNDNSLLEEEEKASITFPLIFTPAIFLNSELYRGDIEAEEVALAVCASYSSPPALCNSPQLIPPPRTMSLTTLLALVALTTVLVAGVLLLYRLWIKREMQAELKDQVSRAVAQYHALSSDGAQMAERPKVRTVVRKIDSKDLPR